MTVIVGLIARDGIVLASDSQATAATSGQQVRLTVQKLFTADGVFAWGLSGPNSHSQVVREVLADHHDYGRLIRPRDVRNMLHSRVGAVLSLENQHAAAAGNPRPASSALLFAGYAQGPRLFELSSAGVCEDHEALGFAAVGSGDIFTYHALAAFSEFNVREMPLSRAVILACRIVDDAIRSAAQFLGLPIRIAVVEPAGSSGQARLLPDDDVRKARDDVLLWKGAEAEFFRDFGFPAPTVVATE